MTDIGNRPAKQDKSAPRIGCSCAVCRWARERAARDADLRANYDRYTAGLLVADA